MESRASWSLKIYPFSVQDTFSCTNSNSSPPSPWRRPRRLRASAAHQCRAARDTRTASADGAWPLSPWSDLAQAGDDDGEGLEDRARQVFGTAPPPPANLPDKSLDQELLFKFLLSEIAGQRGNLQLAAQGYLDMAKSTRDPRLAKRATEIANYARLPTLALEASRLWYDTDKGNPQARQALVSALLSNNKLQEAKPLLQAMLSADGDIAHGFLQLQSLLGKAGDKAAVLNITRELAKSYPQMPEAHFAVAQAAFAAGKYELANSEAAEAMRLRPDWELGALLQAQMIQQRESPAKAAEYLEELSCRAPEGPRRARQLRAPADRQQEAARRRARSTRSCSTSSPSNADIAVTIGLLSLQLDEFDTAEASLKRGLRARLSRPGHAAVLHRPVVRRAQARRRSHESGTSRWKGATSTFPHRPAMPSC